MESKWSPLCLVIIIDSSSYSSAVYLSSSTLAPSVRMLFFTYKAAKPRFVLINIILLLLLLIIILLQQPPINKSAFSVLKKRLKMPLRLNFSLQSSYPHYNHSLSQYWDSRPLTLFREINITPEVLAPIYWDRKLYVHHLSGKAFLLSSFRRD